MSPTIAPLVSRRKSQFCELDEASRAPALCDSDDEDERPIGHEARAPSIPRQLFGI